MKQRATGESAAAAVGGGGGGVKKGKGQWSRKRRNEQRLGGGKGLSLEAFVNAKSKNSGYNPALIKKQREFYKNAKFVSKYKRSLKQQGQSSNRLPLPINQDGDREAEDAPRPTKRKKWHIVPSLQDEYAKKKAEEEKTKMEREAIVQAKREERARAEVKRKELKEKMSKRTRFGQPVMKFRIEHLLESAIESSKN